MSLAQKQLKIPEAQEWQMLAGFDLDVEELEQRLEMALLTPLDCDRLLNCGTYIECGAYGCTTNQCFTDGCSSHCCVAE